ncbi:hypothetical protein M2280_006009 [Prescottella agglutinans]|uniref:Uncharacterized protein n=1 Tax=Prescottella agglutinans TaxID=1644129 RepID=A0ABT6MK96_9NOCA|nr:hypothetical protein [Prescottella agglutinans]
MLGRSVMPVRRPTKLVVGLVAAAAGTAIAVGGAGVASAADTGSLDVKAGRILVDGVYRVGFDVQPGTYTTAGAWPGSLLPCTWSRVKTLPLGGIATIEHGNSFGPVTVTIDPGDDGFMTAGCRGWSQAGGPGSVDAGSLGGSLDVGSLSTGSLGS